MSTTLDTEVTALRTPAAPAAPAAPPTRRPDASAPTPSFYRKPLPEPLIEFSSAEGRQVFREALAEGNLEGYFALAEQFHTQSDPAFCGLGTLVVALNALGIDPGRLWKGPWRWYSEEMLDCCVPLDVVRAEGLTLDTLACLARCNGARAEVHRADQGDEAALRAAIVEASREARGSVLAVAYSRKELGQTGDGHFSPVAGYHAGRDLALLLDVARFKYPPHWVPVSRLWAAMQPHDPATGRPRGHVTLRRGELPATLYYSLSLARCSWPELASHLFQELPGRLRAAHPADLATTVHVALEALPASVCEAARSVEQLVQGHYAPEHQAQVDALRSDLRTTALFDEVRRQLPNASCCADRARPPAGAADDPDGERAELLTVLLLLATPWLLPALDGAAREQLTAMTDEAALPPRVATEMAWMRGQIEALTALRA